MALIDDLVNRIDDIELRQRIKTEIDKLSKQKKFGLVFEDHLPEFTPLYDLDIKVGNTVALKDSKATKTYTVQSIENNLVTVIDKVTKENSTYPIEKLVVVAEFGEPIYPYLEKLDSIENAPGDDLWHILIESDNYHALQLLGYLYVGQIDCIYIDPPYNTGASDWKYNNNYVDSSDIYRHSKWLSMMEKRLKLAKRLLNPKDSVLICTIDEKEYHHLGVLLEEIFPEARIQMISVAIHSSGNARAEFSRNDEYYYYVFMGDSGPTPIAFGTEWQQDGVKRQSTVRWESLLRSGVGSAREDSPNLFYPVLFDRETEQLVGFGKPVEQGVAGSDYRAPDGTIAVLPYSSNGQEARWRISAERAKELYEIGAFDWGNFKGENTTLKYLKRGELNKVQTGIYTVTGYKPNGAMIISSEGYKPKWIPSTQWNVKTHEAGGKWGSGLITKIFGEKRFDYPKSLYAVRDALRMVLENKPEAIVLDFFAGSGTTAHAVNLLNLQDGGSRQCIMVTNNEVSKSESNKLLKHGYQPGDHEWEKLGIARYVTWPRLTSTITGLTVNGDPINENYILQSEDPVSKPRYFKKIDFTNKMELNTASKKKGLLSLIDKDKNDLTQSMIKANTEFIVSDEHNTSILFNIDYKDEWLDALEDMNHIINFYIVANNREYNNIKKELENLLGDYEETGEIKVPMSNGFPTNAIFFKIGFLNKDSVALGRQFKELLSVLWMKAGAIGECPDLDDSELPGYLFFSDNRFAVLLNETQYASFREELDNHSEIETVFIVTNSEKGFTEMSSGLGVSETHQLYRDYLDNFRINVRRS